jgi:hypothetical protein
MQFIEEQWGLLYNINHIFREIGRSGVNNNKSSDRYNSDIGGYTQSSQPKIEQAPDYAKLNGILFAFLIVSIKTKVNGAIYINALLCFFTATAIRQGSDGFQPAGLFTAIVAAML